MRRDRGLPGSVTWDNGFAFLDVFEVILKLGPWTSFYLNGQGQLGIWNYRLRCWSCMLGFSDVILTLGPGPSFYSNERGQLAACACRFGF